MPDLESAQPGITGKLQDERFAQEGESENGTGVRGLLNPSHALVDNKQPNKARTSTRANIPCRFWATKKGCRAGTSCPYRHVETARDDLTPSTSNLNDINQAAKDESKLLGDGRSAQISRVVSKPTSQQNSRHFQIQQLKRRFSPSISDHETGTRIEIQLIPSDPDFPFDMPFLDCVLNIPITHPSSEEIPTINVRNKEMERGYQINVERGFENIVTVSPNSSLLRWINTLDKRLEEFLSQNKAETIKIVSHKVPTTKSFLAENSCIPNTQPPATLNPNSTALNKCIKGAPISEYYIQDTSSNFNPQYGTSQLQEAHTILTTETRQLEARMSRLLGYSKSHNKENTIYQLPIEPHRRLDLPMTLRKVKSVRLIVPQKYPLDPSSLELIGVEGPETENVQRAWKSNQNYTGNQTSTNLMEMVNDLAINLHTWARQPPPACEPTGSRSPGGNNSTDQDGKGSTTKPNSARRLVAQDFEDRLHIQYIPRPSEWTEGNPTSDYESSSHSSFEDDPKGDQSTDEEETEATSIENPAGSSISPQHGIGVSFPSLVLVNIELLTLQAISLTLKCLRCKQCLEITGVATGSRSKTISCPKCSTLIAASYQSQLMHPSSFRAGYITLTNAMPQDLLPSPFTPSCASCSNAIPGPGLTGVRGDTLRAVCRSCHQHLSFSLPEVKFLSLSSYAARHGADRAPRRKAPKEHLGLVAGDPLPRQGRCKHYGRSYRWFRFSCCGKVFPCDKCHDEAEVSHPNERAERMVCGWCSREQRFRPDDCGICHVSVVRKKGGGFWEGGKGTRDKIRMSRKDKRKYRRTPAEKAKGKE